MWNEILSCVFAWAVAVWLLPRLDWRSWQARYSLVTYVGVVVVATLRLPIVAQFLDRSSSLTDLSRLLQYWAMVGLALAWAHICIGIAPAENQSRRWIVKLAPIICLAIGGVWWVGSWQHSTSILNSPRSDFSLSITMLAQWQVFATTVGIGFPTTTYCFQREPNSAVRLRYASTLLMQLAAGIMTGTVMAIHGVMLLDGLPRAYQSSAINGLMLVTGVLYLVSVLPLKWYVTVARLMQHVRNIGWVYKIRRLERSVARRVGQSPKTFAWRDWLLTPDYVLYTLVIAILDARKRLHANECAHARQFARHLDSIAKNTQNYTEVVLQLQRSQI